MKTKPFFTPQIGSRVRIIGTQAVGIIEDFESSIRLVNFKIIVVVRYKNNRKRRCRESELGIILPKFLHWAYPFFDGKKTLKELFRFAGKKIEARADAFFGKMIKSNLDAILILICAALAITLILSYLIK